MVLQNGEYKIENDGIWVKKEVLEQLRDHYAGIGNGIIKCDNKEPNALYYIGKADICKDLLKMFEPLEG